MGRILTVTTEPIREGETFVVLAVEDLGSQKPGGDTRAERAQAEVVPLFVRPDDGGQGMARPHAVVVERSHDLDGAHAPDVSVEVATVEHGIDVRAEKQER